MRWPFGLFPSRRPPWHSLDFDADGLTFGGERIPWDRVYRATAGLQDRFTTDLIWIALEYLDAGGAENGLNLWEEWPRFVECEEFMRRRFGFDDEPLGYLRTHAFSERQFVLFERERPVAP